MTEGQIQQQQNPEQAHSQALLNTSLMARDSYAAGDANKFYVYVSVALNLASPVMSLEVRQRIESDHHSLLNKLEEIEKMPIHESSKNELMLKHKFAFAERHMHAIFTAMSRTDLIRPRAEGSVNFTKSDLDGWAAAVQGKQGAMR